MNRENLLSQNFEGGEEDQIVEVIYQTKKEVPL